jgi:hypothetical protein
LGIKLFATTGVGLQKASACVESVTGEPPQPYSVSLKAGDKKQAADGEPPTESDRLSAVLNGSDEIRSVRILTEHLPMRPKPVLVEAVVFPRLFLHIHMKEPPILGKPSPEGGFARTGYTG